MPETLTPLDVDEMRSAVQEALDDLESMKREILSVTDHHTTAARLLRDDYWGKLAATRKRLAEVEYLTGQGDWRSTLRRVLDDYREALKTGVSVDHWVIGQFVVLRSVLNEAPRRSSPSESPEEHWAKAWSAVRRALESLESNEQMWAHSSMADLLMVAQAEGWRIPRQMADLEGMPTDRAIGPGDVVAELDRMVGLAAVPEECEALWPTFRQFWRWRDWWKKPAWQPAADDGFAYLWPLVRRRLGLGTEPQDPGPETPPRGTETRDAGLETRDQGLATSD